MFFFRNGQRYQCVPALYDLSTGVIFTGLTLRSRLIVVAQHRVPFSSDYVFVGLFLGPPATSTVHFSTYFSVSF